MPQYHENDIPGIDVRISGLFNDKSASQMRSILERFMIDTALRRDEDFFVKGMFLAQHPLAFDHPRRDGLTLNAEEREMLTYDDVPVKDPSGQNTSFKIDFQKWRLPRTLKYLVFLCALGATVQGWDEAAVNGAQTWYQPAMKIYIQPTNGIQERPLIVGLVNSAPYLCCVVSCWFTPYLNKKFGRRGTIFLTAIFSAAFALAQAFANDWQTLFALRFLMGLGIGPKSATVPIYAAESAPANIRGSLVMLWQAFTAIGIMFGCISGVIFQNVGKINDQNACPPASSTSNPNILLSFSCSINWRLMLASPCLAPIVLAAYIFTLPESPRWLIAKGHALKANGRPNGARKRYQQAYKGLKKLRLTELQAARDMFLIFHLLEKEKEEVNRIKDDPRTHWWKKGAFQLFAERRNRRAIIASLICMFAQQFCGVNVIVYYSNFFLQNAFKNENYTPQNSTRITLLYTMGFGIINFVFAIPAFYTIDAIGRRTLLLVTFPLLAIFQLWISISFAVAGTWGKSWQLGLAGMYLFGIAYSPGEGPVPFVYAAESLPLYIRDKGMGFVTSINWLFNWLIAFTFTEFFNTFKDYGAFLWYAVWCVILWFLIFFYVPETRLLTLEQLDIVFRQKSGEFRKLAAQRAIYNTKRLFRVEAKRPLSPYANVEIEMTSRPTWSSANDSEDESPPNHRRPSFNDGDTPGSDSQTEV